MESEEISLQPAAHLARYGQFDSSEHLFNDVCNVVRVPLDAAGQDVAPITASPRAARRISKALGHGRVGMEVTVAFTDELGNRVTRKVAVKLRR